MSGYRSGYFEREEEEEITQRINDSGAGILVLGMGVPRQELWIQRNKQNLLNVNIIVAGGAIIDFFSGEIKRAPIWMRKLSLEWAYRLYLEPGRLWKRYLIGNLVFFYNIYKTRRKIMD